MSAYSKYTVKQKKEFWQKNPLHGAIDIKVKGLPEFKMMCHNDDTVVKELYWTKYEEWELSSLLLWKALLTSCRNTAIYDIGSYSGIYSLLAAMEDDANEVIAFDIQEDCIERVKENSALNGLTNIQSILAACSDFNGETTFYFYKEKDIMSSVASLKPNQMNNLEKQIEAIRIDDFKNRTHPDTEVGLIKIDVEGAEQETLKGMKDLLATDQPDMLIEINKPEEVKQVKALFPRNYSVYDVNEDVLEIKRLGWFVRPTKHRNYLFTIKSKSELKSIFKGKVS